MNQHYHLYDQGLLNLLLRKDPEKIKQFVESANFVLHINLYEDSFIIVPRPSSFIEAIGFSNYNNFIKIDKKITKNDVLLLKDENGQLLYERYKQNLEVYLLSTNFSLLKYAWLLYYPLIINIRAYHSLQSNHEFKAALIKKAEEQIEFIPKDQVANISSDLIDAIMKEPLQDLKSNSYFKEEIIEFLATEYTQQFDYETVLASYIPDKIQRKKILEIIYHNIISEAVRNVATGFNGSYIRGLDKAYKYLNNNEAGKKYLDNNKDLVDGDIIDLAIRGYNGQPVHIFTTDSKISLMFRLNRAIQLLNWASDYLKVSLFLNKGFIYFVDEDTLQIMESETIDVSAINTQDLT